MAWLLLGLVPLPQDGVAVAARLGGTVGEAQQSSGRRHGVRRLVAVARQPHRHGVRQGDSSKDRPIVHHFPGMGRRDAAQSSWQAGRRGLPGFACKRPARVQPELARLGGE